MDIPPLSSSIPAELKTYLVFMARSALPAECCGALLGSSDFTTRWDIQRTIDLTNRSETTATEYIITSDDVRFAQRKARTFGMDVVGFYHSHPNGVAEPSATDLERAWPGYIYVIVAGEGVSGWTLDEQTHAFARVDLP